MHQLSALITISAQSNLSGPLIFPPHGREPFLESSFPKGHFCRSGLLSLRFDLRFDVSQVLETEFQLGRIRPLVVWDQFGLGGSSLCTGAVPEFVCPGWPI